MISKVFMGSKNMKEFHLLWVLQWQKSGKSIMTAVTCYLAKLPLRLTQGSIENEKLSAGISLISIYKLHDFINFIFVKWKYVKMMIDWLIGEFSLVNKWHIALITTTL